MADPVYCEVIKFAVKEIHDDKLKARMADVMTAAAEAAVKKASKLTSTKPKEKDAKGWSVQGSLVLGPSKDGKKFGAKVSAVVTTWPGKAIKAMPSGDAAFAIKPDEKVSTSDAEQVVKQATEQAMKTAVSFMESKKPE